MTMVNRGNDLNSRFFPLIIYRAPKAERAQTDAAKKVEKINFFFVEHVDRCAGCRVNFNPIEDGTERHESLSDNYRGA